MFFYGYFQTDVLINFFIPLRQTEATPRENLFIYLFIYLFICVSYVNLQMQ